MTDEWGTVQGYNRIHGDPAHVAATVSGGPPYPGEAALNNSSNGYASTDSLIYP